MNGTYVGKLALAGRLAVTAFFVLLSSRTLYAQTEISAETSAVYTDHQPGEDDKNGVIKGKISTADGEAAAYVSVVLKGTHKGTLTAADGSFSLHNVRPGSYTLVVSHAGLQTLEKKLTVDDGEVLVLTLSLKENARQMDEVVINGRKNVNSTPVTAGKLPVATRDLPQSVQIIGNQVINDQQGNRLSDIMKNVNGVALGTTRGAVSETFYARGYSLGSNNILKNGSRTSAASMPEASTLESVEVLKGSAALLYGGVTGGAVVNLVTKKPKFNYGGEISFRTGSYDFYKPTVDLYGPISEKLAFRVVGTYEKSGSYRETVFSKRYYINPSLLYKISDKTSLLLQTDFLNTNFRPDFGIGTIDGKLIPVNEIDRGAYYNTTWAYNKVKQNNTSLNLDHRINDSWNLNFIGAYQSYDRNYFGADRIAANAEGDVARNLTRTVSHEKTYTGQVNFIGQEKTGNIGHTLLIGIDGEATNTVTNAFNFPTFYDSINIVDRSKLFPEGYRMRTDMPVTPVTGYTKTPTYRFGAYVQDLIALSTRFKVLAGLRWSYQESPQKTVYDNATQVLSREGEHKIDKAFSPKLGLVYQPFTFLSTFASYTNNFSPNSGMDLDSQALRPSIIDQFEAGVKTDFFEGKLSLNVSVYRIINNDIALQSEYLKDGITPNNDPAIKTFNGQTTSDGFEVDLNGALSKNIYVMAGYSNNFIRFTKTPGIKGSNIEGERLVNTTAETANGTIFYTFSETALKGIKLGASVFYTGRRNAGWNNKVGQTQPGSRIINLGGFTTFDASIGYAFKRFSILGKISNITDELNYFVHENYSVNPIPPRQFMATVSYKF